MASIGIPDCLRHVIPCSQLIDSSSNNRFGVYQIPDADEYENAVYEALLAGYRLIDTATGYLNEEAVGRAIKRSGVPREELFITTKIWVQDAGYESAKLALAKSPKKLAKISSNYPSTASGEYIHHFE